MKCVEIGTIQAYIDGELDISVKKKIQKHLEECEDCGKAYENLKKTDDIVFGKLSTYRQFCEQNYAPSGKRGSNKAVETPDSQKIRRKSERSRVVQFILKYKKAVTAACVAIALTLCVTVQPVRAFISEALNIFRVENVKSLQISFSDMEEIRSQLEQKEGEIDLKNFGKIVAEGFTEQNISAGEARVLAVPAILLPPEINEDNIDINVTQSGILSFTMNVGNVNEALKSFGAEKLLPNNLDGKTFTAMFEAQAEYLYHEGESYYAVIQTKAPELAVPADVNVEQMYECLAELPIIPEDMRRQLKSITDWKNTFYLPVVGEPQEVSVHSAKGFIAKIENGGWMLIWYGNGTVFSVEGNSGKEDILRFAESLR